MLKYLCAITFMEIMFLSTVQPFDFGYFPWASDCYYGDDDSSLYTGFESTTVSGRTCQRWDQQYPHEHRFGDSTVDWKYGTEENYCRGYEYKKPWCYTTDPDVRWEECDVEEC